MVARSDRPVKAPVVDSGDGQNTCSVGTGRRSINLPSPAGKREGLGGGADTSLRLAPGCASSAPDGPAGTSVLPPPPLTGGTFSDAMLPPTTTQGGSRADSTDEQVTSHVTGHVTPVGSPSSMQKNGHSGILRSVVAPSPSAGSATMVTTSDNHTTHMECLPEWGRGRDQKQVKAEEKGDPKEESAQVKSRLGQGNSGNERGQTSGGSRAGKTSSSRGGPRPAQTKGSARPLMAPSAGGTLSEEDSPSASSAAARTPSIGRSSTREADAPLDVSKALSFVQEVIQERPPPPSRCASTVVEGERPGTRVQSRLTSRAMSRGLCNSRLSSLPREPHSTAAEDIEARRLEDIEARRLEDIEAKRLEDIEARRLEDIEARRLEDIEARRLEDIEARRLEDIEARRLEDIEARRLEDIEARRLKDIEARRLEDIEARRLEQKRQRREEAARKTQVVREQRERMEHIKWKPEKQGTSDGEYEMEEERRRKQLFEQLERERLEMQLHRAREEEARRREEEEERARQLHELELLHASKAREEEQRLREARRLDELRHLEEERWLWELIAAGVQEEQSWVQRQWEELEGVVAGYYSGKDYWQQLMEEEERVRERERALREEQERAQAERLKAELLRQRALLHRELQQEWLACSSVQLTPAFTFSYFPARGGPCP